MYTQLNDKLKQFSPWFLCCHAIFKQLFQKYFLPLIIGPICIFMRSKTALQKNRTYLEYKHVWPPPNSNIFHILLSMHFSSHLDENKSPKYTYIRDIASEISFCVSCNFVLGLPLRKQDIYCIWLEMNLTMICTMQIWIHDRLKKHQLFASLSNWVGHLSGTDITAI